ncbi:MAG: polymer-forming cytoskeletal protein [bacterium]
MVRRKKIDDTIVSSIVGEDTRFVGNLNTESSVRIEGSFEGNIFSQGDVYIGAQSHVKGGIIAKMIYISGEVIGNIEALKGITISNTGRVYGDIKGDHLNIEEGGLYKGKVLMDVLSSENRYETVQSFSRAN